MSAAFTPGPWEAKHATDGYFHDVNILRPDGLAIAIAVDNGGIGRDQALANANLIAAAPALYGFVAACAELDPIFAKGYEKERIAIARHLVAKVAS